MRNEETTRTVRMDAADLSIEDMIVDMDGQVIGIVADVPEIDHREHTVTFTRFTTDRGNVPTQYRATKTVRVELERRVS